MKFLYKPISNKRQIGKKRKLADIKYLIIHDTGNTSRGADALAHYNYLQSAKRYGSAHYFADDKGVIQTIGDSLTAWSIGDSWGYSNNPSRIKDAYNFNSISIELCINSNIDENKAYKNLVELTKNLMVKFNIPEKNVIRHFDATGKYCPGSWKKDNWEKWETFKEDIRKPIVWEIDLSKNSEFGDDNLNDYENHWAKNEIEEVKEAGIMNGYPDGSFRPDDKVTRAELATVISKLLKKN